MSDADSHASGLAPPGSSSDDDDLQFTQAAGLEHPHQQAIGGARLQPAPHSPTATSSSIGSDNFPLAGVTDDEVPLSTSNLKMQWRKQSQHGS